MSKVHFQKTIKSIVSTIFLIWPQVHFQPQMVTFIYLLANLFSKISFMPISTSMVSNQDDLLYFAVIDSWFFSPCFPMQIIVFLFLWSTTDFCFDNSWFLSQWISFMAIHVRLFNSSLFFTFFFNDVFIDSGGGKIKK